MSSRVVYDSNPEIRALVVYARGVKQACGLFGIDGLDEFEYDYVMGQFKKGTNPVLVAQEIKRWHDLAEKNFPTGN